MFLAEIDPVQIIIIVIAMGAGFVQWLWGLIKQNLEEKNRRPGTPISEEERAAREEAWRKQLEARPVNKPPRPSPTSTPAPGNPWDTVRDVFEHLKEEGRKASQPVEPQRAPQQQQPARRQNPRTVRRELQPVPPPLPAEPFPAPAKPVLASSTSTASTPPVHFSAPALPPRLSAQGNERLGADMDPLRQLLSSPAGMRQAVLLREILGPPKALQSSGDAAF